MRRIYLIRHAQSALPAKGFCLSRSDAPLSPAGREQADALRRWRASHPVEAVYASPALRCVETAQFLLALNVPLILREELREVDVGLWEGLSFQEIRRRWPGEYARRGRRMGTVAPPGGESFAQAGRRLESALADILPSQKGDLAVVSHGGILRGWLCGILGVPMDRVLEIPQPWGGISLWEPESGNITSLGVKPADYPGQEEIRSLFARRETPESVQLHGQAVARRALSLAERWPGDVDRGLLQAACLLHDLCREMGRDHPAQGAAFLCREGYPKLAGIVARHHDLGENPSGEAALLYLADKLTSGVRPVTLAERFAASREKCAGGESLSRWQKRYEDALRIQKYLKEEP